MRIVNETDQALPPTNEEALFSCAEDVLGKKLDPITLIFVSKEKGAELNERTRNTKGATNVLSFPEDREIVITPHVVRKEAEEQGVSSAYWMQRLIVHGILHLEGYTHDESSSAEEMEALEVEILERLESSKSQKTNSN